MHLLRIDRLARELALGKVSAREGMHYFLATSLVALAGAHYELWLGPRAGPLFHIELVVLVLSTWIGVLECWKVGAGANFVFNITCLALPASVQVGAMSIGFGLLLGLSAESVFAPSTFVDPRRAYELVSFAGFAGFATYFWYLMWRALRTVQRAGMANIDTR